MSDTMLFSPSLRYHVKRLVLISIIVTAVLVLQVTGLGNCDMMKQMSAHFCSISRVTAYHVEDLRCCMAAMLSPAHLQLFDNMMHRMETLVQAAASKVRLVCKSIAIVVDGHQYLCAVCLLC